MISSSFVLLKYKHLYSVMISTDYFFKKELADQMPSVFSPYSCTSLAHRILDLHMPDIMVQWNVVDGDRRLMTVMMSTPILLLAC